MSKSPARLKLRKISTSKRAKEENESSTGSVTLSATEIGQIVSYINSINEMTNTIKSILNSHNIDISKFHLDQLKSMQTKPLAQTKQIQVCFHCFFSIFVIQLHQCSINQPSHFLIAIFFCWCFVTCAF